MEDCLKNWSEQEKEVFYGALEIEDDSKALHNFIANASKVSPI